MDLDELFESSQPTRPQAFEGIVANDPSDGNDNLFVTIDAFDGGQHKWGPCPFMPKAGQLPEKGDRALVVFSDTGEPWVTCWWNNSATYQES